MEYKQTSIILTEKILRESKLKAAGLGVSLSAVVRHLLDLWLSGLVPADITDSNVVVVKSFPRVEGDREQTEALLALLPDIEAKLKAILAGIEAREVSGDTDG